MGTFSNFLPSRTFLSPEDWKRQEEERKRQEADRLAQESAALQERVRPQMPTQNVSVMPNPTSQNIPDAGPEPRFGMSRFLLGDRMPEPKADTATGAYLEMLRTPEPKQGLLRGLGELFVPGAMDAFTDTYREKMARAREAAATEQRQEQIRRGFDYQNVMREQMGSKEEIARLNEQQRRDAANMASADRRMGTQAAVLRSMIGADGREVSAEEVQAFVGDPNFIVTQSPVNPERYFVRSSVQRVAADKYEGGEKPKQEAAQTHQTDLEGLRHQNRLGEITARGDQTRLTQNTRPGANVSATRERGRALAADYLSQYGGDVNAARSAVMEAQKDGEIESGVAFYALDGLKVPAGAKNTIDWSTRFGGGKVDGAPPATAPPAKPKAAPRARKKVGDEIVVKGKRYQITAVTDKGYEYGPEELK